MLRRVIKFSYSVDMNGTTLASEASARDPTARAARQLPPRAIALHDDSRRWKQEGALDAPAGDHDANTRPFAFGPACAGPRLVVVSRHRAGSDGPGTGHGRTAAQGHLGVAAAVGRGRQGFRELPALQP